MPWEAGERCSQLCVGQVRANGPVATATLHPVGAGGLGFEVIPSSEEPPPQEAIRIVSMKSIVLYTWVPLSGIWVPIRTIASNASKIPNV